MESYADISIGHFRDITQSEEGGAGFGASKQGCLDAFCVGDDVNGDDVGDDVNDGFNPPGG